MTWVKPGLLRMEDDVKCNFQVVGCEKLAGPEEEEIRAGSPTNMEEILGVSEGNRPALL